ncbi:MAG: hypothetical protein HY831_04750 [Candidatus Aenigmarchaeota archaeon]|nr:hypothetical protein [Candidatus Aenigmarchaeota archaeon]
MVTKVYALGDTRRLLELLSQEFGSPVLTQGYSKNGSISFYTMSGNKLFASERYSDEKSEIFSPEGNGVVVEYDNDIVGTCFEKTGFREMYELDLGEKV